MENKFTDTQDSWSRIVFLMRVVLSQLSDVEIIVFITLELPDVPNAIIYDGRHFEFDRYLKKTGAPRYIEVEDEEAN